MLWVVFTSISDRPSLLPLRNMPALQSSALLLLSGLLIGLSDCLNPRDPNVCSLWER